MTSERLILFDVGLSTKEAVIRALVDVLFENGVLSSKEAFLQAVMEREAISPTGLEKGLAIPHGKSKAVNRAAFAIARLSSPIKDWKALILIMKYNLCSCLRFRKQRRGRRT